MKHISIKNKKYPLRYLTYVALIMSSSVLAQTITLTNHDWSININPASLDVTVQNENKIDQPLTNNTVKHSVSNLSQTAGQAAQWVWDKNEYTVSTKLNNSDLTVSITSHHAATLPILNLSTQNLGEALILPIAEGHYIPINNPQWQTFLVNNESPIDTSQELSLPLFGVSYPHLTAHWILTNPFNNRITFNATTSSPLNMQLSHEFTTLEPTSTMSMILHLDHQHDLLAGAKRYRQWLIDHQQFVSLKDKLATIPNGNNLIGSSYLYLWGNDLLGQKDVANWAQLISCLKRHDLFTAQLTPLFSQETDDLLLHTPKNLNNYEKRTLLADINQALNTIAHRAWQGSEPDNQKMIQIYPQLRSQVKQYLGSALIKDDNQWGDTLSLATLNTLNQAKLPHLWLGLADGFEGGLWHPEVIKAAVDDGYFIGPYDSYETALPKKVNPDWSTAHLGHQAYHQCTITQKDGTLKLGFQKMGHYTDPTCIQPWLKNRIAVIAQHVPYNSWFIDAYSSGMVFNNYDPHHPSTEAQYAENTLKNLDWISKTLTIPIGSEDGNATTNRSIIFAHGMQTPVIGWGDPDQKNPHSPYFLGQWYPNNQPTTFFKPSNIKPMFKTVYFDPRYRLPLYQTVFHDSVITTHHWLFDNIKLTNVRQENQLMQLFYNVPSLYNISQATLSQRLAELKKEDAFFRPVHQQLSQYVITHFDWLNAEHNIQSLRFSDGSMLYVNASKVAYQQHGISLPAYSVTAQLKNGKTYLFQSE